MTKTVTTQTVAKADDGQRLDRWFKQYYPQVPYSLVQKWLRTGQVRVEGRRVKPADRIAAGQKIRIPPNDGFESKKAQGIKGGSKASPQLSKKQKAELSERIVYQDEDMLVIDKPAGLAVQGGTGIRENLSDMLADLPGVGAETPPKLAHRLDKDTAGLMVFAKTREAAAFLTGAFRDGQVEKTYWALCVGNPSRSQGRIDQPLAKKPTPKGEKILVDPEGRPAVTHYRVLRKSQDRQVSWLELTPETGRMHQLRVHLADLGVPIVGDGKYGGRTATQVDVDGTRLERQLHLLARGLVLPRPGGGVLNLEAPLPEHMEKSWHLLGFSVSSPAKERRHK